MTPTLSIGIPVLNGGRSLRRAVQSVLAQTLADFELVISDNGSTDETPEICREFTRSDSRVRWLRSEQTIPASDNFQKVMNATTGALFMWLGHDDWLDPTHAERCIRMFDSDPAVALVSGRPRYYRDGVHVRDGKVIVACENDPRLRTLNYLLQVTDNGIFYGVYRRAALNNVPFVKVMAWDWLLLASIAYQGKIITLPDLPMNRELGGATRNHRAMARSLQVPEWQGMFPYTAAAWGLLTNIAVHSPVFDKLSLVDRTSLGLGAVGCIASKRAWGYASAAWRLTQSVSGNREDSPPVEGSK